MSDQIDECGQLRAEIAQLREIMQSQERENTVLRNLLSEKSRPAGSSGKPAVFQIGSRERMAMLEHTVDVLDSCVRGIAQWDCYNNSEEDCTCATCRAEFALAEIKDWRYGGSQEQPSRRFEGACHRRTTDGWNPSEAKIHQSWVKHMETWRPDRTLGMILSDRVGGLFSDVVIDWPSSRDWYVATSVVQWLATPIGSLVLEGAGWKYTQRDEDRCAVDQLRVDRQAVR